MIRVVVSGPGSDKVSADLKYFFQVGQRKIVRHYKEEAPEEIPPCDIAILEIKEVK